MMNGRSIFLNFRVMKTLMMLLCVACISKAQIPVMKEVGALQMPRDIKPVKAPFKMPVFKRPVFPALTVTASANIQSAIDQVYSKGGGTVNVPAGKWKTGRIILKSNVNLHLSTGAELWFSGEVEDYLPVVFTRNEGIEMMSLGACIYANGQTNIAVTGEGKLIGPPADCPIRKRVMRDDVIEKMIPYDKPVAQRIYDGANGTDIFLPMFISPINCKNVFIEGISLENTPFWNIVPEYCDHVIIRGVTVNSVGIPRGDGMDMESSKNILIEYCTLSCGDDCFTMKAGRGEDGLRVNKPTENVVVRYCLAGEGHGGITVGSETAGMIRNLYVHDVVFNNTGVGIRFKTRRPRGGGGENLYYERIRMNLTEDAFRWDMLGSRVYVGELADRLPIRKINRLTPLYRNISAKDIIIEHARTFIRIDGIPESPMTHFSVENAAITCKNILISRDATGISVKNAVIHSEDSLLTMLDTRNLLFDHVRFIVPGNKLVTDISGELSDSLEFKKTIPEKPTNWQITRWLKP
jgi:hypothetical protein